MDFQRVLGTTNQWILTLVSWVWIYWLVVVFQTDTVA